MGGACCVSLSAAILFSKAARNQAAGLLRNSSKTAAKLTENS